MNFLANAGMKVYKPNERQYIATIPAIKGVEIVFQRPVDIFRKVSDASVDLGITGYDVMREYDDEGDDVIVIEQLGFGGCSLLVAVPDSWIDTSTITDLADLSLDYKQRGKELRIATKYRHLTRDWLFKNSITHFSLVDAEGALEAAPRMGYADMIADISATGTTLKENRLKTLEGGTILDSEACLIANKRNLLDHKTKLRLTKHILELLEAYQRSRTYVSLTANIKGSSPKAVGDKLIQHPLLSGLVGPTISEIRAKTPTTDGWYAVTIIIEKANLINAMEHLRAEGGTDISIVQPSYIFAETSKLFEKLQEMLTA